MSGPLPVILSITHQDPELKKLQSWFLEQPGIEWTLKNSDDTSLSRLVISRKRSCLQTPEGEVLFFHPSMALLRLMTILKGDPDRFLNAACIQEGDFVVDATMGLATDALIAAWAVGKTGKVTAIERSPIICALVRRGLLDLCQGKVPKVSNPLKQRAWEELARAAQRIEVVWGDHYAYLQAQPARSCDIVYFDPMFRRTREQSAAIRPLHHWSDRNPLEREAIAEAHRVARKRIILKERKNSREFERLGFTVVAGGKYSPVDYGVISVDGGRA